MNLCHRLCCSSDRWAKEVEDQLLPWVLADVDLGDNTLEIGPGYGANIAGAGRQDAEATPRWKSTSPMAQRLQTALRRPGPHHQRRRHRHRIAGQRVQLGGVASPCCTTSRRAELQDRLFAEAFRVLRPGGVFAGSDSVPSLHVPNPAFPRHLQPGAAGDAAGSLARSGISRRGGRSRHAAGSAGARSRPADGNRDG